MNELYNKSLKAFYKLKKDLLGIGPSVKTCMHLFDHTIKPILLYNSEVWGSYNVSFKKLSNNSFNPDEFFKNLQCEKLHLKFSKWVLGVHKKSVNFAVLSELGRFPLHFDILKYLISYWYRLENLDNTFPLLKDAYSCSVSLHENNKQSWYSMVNKVLEFLNINNCSKNFGIYKFKNFLKNKLAEIYTKLWYKTKSSLKEGKLCTYFKLKQHFGFENYLSEITKFEYRKSICKLRISAHKLMIEVGRYVKIDRNERYCNKCTSGEIEDEIHFLIKCHKYHQQRFTLFEFIGKEIINFTYLNDEQKFNYLLISENTKILNAVGKFINDHL